MSAVHGMQLHRLLGHLAISSASWFMQVNSFTCLEGLDDTRCLHHTCKAHIRQSCLRHKDQAASGDKHQEQSRSAKLCAGRGGRRYSPCMSEQYVKDCYWAARHITKLLVKFTPKGVILSFLPF